MRSRPAPPYSSGTVSPNSPSSRICSTIVSGNSSRASSSSATGKTSRSTNSRTVATTACCSSESSTSPPGHASAMRLALCLRGREVLEPLAPLHPRGPPPHGELLGHLPAGLVDHLGPEHDRSGELDVGGVPVRSEEHTSELQSRENLVCRLLLEKKKKTEDTVIGYNKKHRMIPD